MSEKDLIGKRKLDHIEICAEEKLERITYNRRTTLLECIELLPLCFPTHSIDRIETKIQFLSATINAPIMVSAMTGGIEQAGRMNRVLASACQQLGIPLAFGSGRIMIEDPSTARSFKVREIAPSIPLIANIGIAQAEVLPVDKLKWLVEEMEADALAIHVNFAMEAFQPEGNRQPAAVVETILRIKSEVNFPVIVKEVGTGFSPQQLELLKQCGADWIDVAGAGGTNWIRIEALRGDARTGMTAAPFSEWGFPTAAGVMWAVKAGHEKIIASGGITSGLEAAKAMAIGARLCGIALPVLRKLFGEGEEAVLDYLETMIDQLKTAAYLCGIGNVKQLGSVPFIIRGELKDWMSQ
jgi:isopentenyl-diphosphate delta-isomerase